MKESFDLTRRLGEKTKEGQSELSSVQESVKENLDILAHEASMDYMGKLNADLKTAVDGGDQAKAGEILKDIFNHKESMKDYASKARENVASYIDSKGEVGMEEFEKQMNDFVKETLVIWYGKDRAEKANIKMLSTPLAEMDYRAPRGGVDFSKLGEFTTNPEMAKMNFIEKEPKVKILAMKEFIGKPRSEVMKTVVEKYGSSYHIPGLEFEKFLLENPDKVPEELKDKIIIIISQARFFAMSSAMPTCHMCTGLLARTSSSALCLGYLIISGIALAVFSSSRNNCFFRGFQEPIYNQSSVFRNLRLLP
jgi:hypothetical protein